MRTTPCFRPLALTLALTLPLVGPDPVAGGTPSAGALPANVTALADPPEPTPVLVSLDFRGGTIGDYVTQLKAAAGAHPLNVLLPSEMPELRMPALSLRDVTVDTAMEAIEYASAADRSSGVQVGVNRFGDHNAGTPVFAVVVRGSSMPKGPTISEPVRTQVISLAPLAGAPGQIRRAMDAIELVVRAAQRENAKAPEILLHEASNLLIVRGTGRQIDEVMQVVERLTVDADVESAEADAQAMRTRELERRILESGARMELEHRKMQAVASRLDRTRQLVKEGLAPEDEAEQVEIELAEHRAEVEILERTLSDLEATLAAQRARSASTTLVTTVLDARDLAERDHQINAFVELLRRSSRNGSSIEFGRIDEGRYRLLATEADTALVRSFLEALRAR